MKISEILNELRKNPEQNIKFNEREQLHQALLKNGGNSDNLFVRFTDEIKLGINPSGEWNAPFGICAYPFDYVINSNFYHNANKGRINVPFGNDREYMIVFKSNMNNVLDLQKIPFKILYQQLLNATTTLFGNDIATAIFSKINNDKQKTIRSIWESITAGLKTVYGHTKDRGIAFRKIIVTAGYEIITDTQGIIHYLEPHQSIFTSMKGLEIVSVIKRPPVYPDKFNPWDEDPRWIYNEYDEY